MIIPPDFIYSTTEAAEHLGLSQRQVQRILKSGDLAGVRRNGRWVITAISIWEYLGIEEKMNSIWLQFCLADHANSKNRENNLKTKYYIY